MEFKTYRKMLQDHFDQLTEDATHLFQVTVDKDEMWSVYLESFPPEYNKIFRERREQDCACCRQFIKNIGSAVVIKDNKVHTIWDFETESEEYQPSINAMAEYVRSKVVTDIYFARQNQMGTLRNFEKTEGTVLTWDHLYLMLPDKFVNNSGKTLGDVKGTYNTTQQVFKRALDELTESSTVLILELIASNTLYKGEEWQAQLQAFLNHQKAYNKLTTESERNMYAWEQSVQINGALATIRNSSIGTLLINLSGRTTEDGTVIPEMDLETAVKKYEDVTAPSNYKRPKAIFTQAMLENAKKTMTELGYMDSLARRHAVLDDITVNNILFTNKDSAKTIGAMDVFDELSGEVAVNPKKFSKVEEISIKDFVANVLPLAKEIEVLFENQHSENMVSLIAPENKEADSMFKWDNAFSWAYSGNVTDSDLTQRVKDAGGRTDGVLRFSHSWNHKGRRNGSLMDLHVFMPNSSQSVKMVSGKEIHNNYGNDQRVGWNKRTHYNSGGSQDVDYTNVAPENYIPVENITFPSMDKLQDGVYTFKIHNWELRNPTSGGFKAEIAFAGQVFKFERKEAMAHHEWLTLAKIELKNGVFTVLEMMDNDKTSVKVWGIKTNQFVPVSVMMFSPNYWDEQDGIGHRHYFFMMKNCINSEQPNGFYNEFLKQDLNKHRKVFEALGSKMAVAKVENQLSGLGFSSTKRNELVVKVIGQSQRVMKIKF